MRGSILGLLAACATPQAVKPSAAVCAADNRELVYIEHQLYVPFVPFGAGQFQNDEPGKGTAFAVSQAVTASTSLGIFTYLALRYGVESDRVPFQDGERVRTLQQVEVATGAMFLALYAWGVADAIMNYRRYVPDCAPIATR